MDGESGMPLVVVGASAGGVDALTALMLGLSPGFPGAIAIVLHLPPNGTSVLPAILTRCGPLPVSSACDGLPIEAGHVYVAPPDHHLVVGASRFALSDGPRENGHRPSVDELFRTAAATHGPDVIGVILSGTLSDGAAGLELVKRHGGRTIVQHPGDARFDGMPRAALRAVRPDAVVPACAIGALLAEMAGAAPRRTDATERRAANAGADMPPRLVVAPDRKDTQA